MPTSAFLRLSPGMTRPISQFEPRRTTPRKTGEPALPESPNPRSAHRRCVDQVAADSDRGRSSTDEIGGVVKVNPTGRDQLHLRQRSSHILQILRAADGRREDLHVAGSGLPGGQDFGRGQRADDGWHPVAAAKLDGGDVERWCDDELSTGENGDAGRFRIEDGSRANVATSGQGQRTCSMTRPASGFVKVNSTLRTPPRSSASVNGMAAERSSNRTIATRPFSAIVSAASASVVPFYSDEDASDPAHSSYRPHLIAEPLTREPRAQPAVDDQCGAGDKARLV